MGLILMQKQQGPWLVADSPDGIEYLPASRCPMPLDSAMFVVIGEPLFDMVLASIAEYLVGWSESVTSLRIEAGWGVRLSAPGVSDEAWEVFSTEPEADAAIAEYLGPM